MAVNSDRRLNQIIDQIFQKAVRIQRNLKQEANKIMYDFLKNQFEVVMLEACPLFRVMYSKNLYYTGSYYDGLKVSQPNEFDINVILKIPSAVKMEVCKDISGYAYYYTKTYPSKESGVGKFFKGDRWLYSSRYELSPEKIMSWFEGALTKAMKKFIPDRNQLYEISRPFSRSGPAFTLHLKGKRGQEIDIDLVPVFSFYDENDDEIFLVPKPPTTSPNLWRLSYTKKEKRQIQALGCNAQSFFKKITKLLKHLRDQQGAPLKQLYSYLIKNFMLLQLRDNSKINWYSERNLADHFCDLLAELQKMIKNKNMPSYFDNNFNLLGKIESKTLENMAGNLQNILKSIKKNPSENIAKCFKYEVKEEFNGIVVVEEQAAHSWCSIS